MRFGIFLFVLVVAVVGAVVFAQLYLSAPLYVEVGGWSASAPLSVMLGVLLLAMLLLGGAVRLLWLLLFLPTQMRRWRDGRRQKKRARLMMDVMRQAAYHDRRGLLKTLEALSPESAAAAWRGAVVAGNLDESAKRMKFLTQAAGGGDALIAAAAKAEICRANNRLTEAMSILKAAGAPRGEALLAEIYYEVGKASGDWRAALSAAVRLQEDAPSLWRTAVDEAVCRQLRKVESLEQSQEFWKDDVSTDDKKRPLLLAAYLSSLARLGGDKTLKEAMTQALKRYPRDNHILEVVVAVGDKEHHEAAFQANESRAAESRAGGSDAAVLRILAELAERLELPGKARRYEQMLNALEPHPRYQKMLSSPPSAGD